MQIPRVYLNQPLAIDEIIDITDDAMHYITRVLRLKTNFQLRVFNGTGGEFDATLIEINKKSARIKLEAFNAENHVSPLRIHLGQAVSKEKKFDYIVQKATELGVHEITPIISTRTERKDVNEITPSQLLRWQKIIISACEQCGRNLIPSIHPPTHLDDWFEQTKDDTQKIILSPDAPTPLILNKQIQEITLLIGPEGGFSDAEMANAMQYDFNPISLGPRILRTETAPLAMLSILQYQAGDFC